MTQPSTPFEAQHRVFALQAAATVFTGTNLVSPTQLVAYAAQLCAYLDNGIVPAA